MIQRDYVMRQVQQLAQVLARVMSLDTAQKGTQGSQWLSREVAAVTGSDLQRLRSLSVAELESVCSPEGQFSSELAVALADVLMEDSRIHSSTGDHRAAEAARAQALLLYTRVRDVGGTLPMDVLKKLTE